MTLLSTGHKSQKYVQKQEIAYQQYVPSRRMDGSLHVMAFDEADQACSWQANSVPFRTHYYQAKFHEYYIFRTADST